MSSSWKQGNSLLGWTVPINKLNELLFTWTVLAKKLLMAKTFLKIKTSCQPMASKHPSQKCFCHYNYDVHCTKFALRLWCNDHEHLCECVWIMLCHRQIKQRVCTALYLAAENWFKQSACNMRRTIQWTLLKLFFIFFSLLRFLPFSLKDLEFWIFACNLILTQEDEKCKIHTPSKRISRPIWRFRTPEIFIFWRFLVPETDYFKRFSAFISLKKLVSGTRILQKMKISGT